MKLTINGDKEMTVDQGSSVLSTLNENGVFLPSACGGKGSCGQCKLQVVEGGGEFSTLSVLTLAVKRSKTTGAWVVSVR